MSYDTLMQSKNRIKTTSAIIHAENERKEEKKKNAAQQTCNESAHWNAACLFTHTIEQYQKSR